MKIVFVIPNFKEHAKEYLILPSIELCIMSAILKNQGHSVEMIDMRINDMEPESIEDILADFSPDIVCIDDIPECHCCTKELLPIIKRNLPEQSFLCVRGEYISFETEMVMRRNNEIDFGLLYETDYVISELIEYKQNKRKLKDISNLAYRDNDKIVVNNIKSIDINELPMPDRKLYDIEKYLKRDSETIVKASRGCPGNCLFCIKTKFEPFKVFSIKRFCDEIEQLQGYGFQSFFFSDDNFAYSMKRLNEFKEELTSRNMKVTWTSNLRIRDITDEKIKLMKELGAYRVFVGIETLNSKTSKVINKNLNREYIEEKLAIIKKYGMQFHASFILGNPGDTEEDLQETLDFVKKISPDLVTFNLIQVYPGLDLYKNPKKYGIIMDDPYWFEKDVWTKDVVMGTEQLPPEILKKWSKKMLYEYIISG